MALGRKNSPTPDTESKLSEFHVDSCGIFKWNNIAYLNVEKCEKSESYVFENTGFFSWEKPIPAFILPSIFEKQFFLPLYHLYKYCMLGLGHTQNQSGCS